MAESSPEVVAVYFPSYHRDDHYDRWYGHGWNEWELMKQARPLFPGHEQPKIPAWGYFDEADPLWMEKQIDLAADHGVTCFLFDWYWYGGDKFLHRALEEGFLKARNRHRMKFFIMWANHTWGVFPATREIFRGHAGESGISSQGQALSYEKPLLEIRHTQEDLEAVARYCADRYMREPNYLKLEGKPVFSFWRWEELEAQLGGVPGVTEGFDRMRSIVRGAGLGDLHITVNIANYENPQTVHCWWPNLIDRAKQAGADSVFGYNVARTHGFPSLTNERPFVPYEDVIASHRELFQLCENRGLPFHPVATIGFDNTPRWHRGAALPIDFRKFFYEPIVVGNTPDQFGLAVQECLDSIDRQSGTTPMLLVNAWNEWTEGNQLLPDERYGNGYLQSLKRTVDGSRKQSL